jgi:AcrR family transcriptional regulator
LDRYSTSIAPPVNPQPADPPDAARHRAVDTATRLFIEHGYERASIRQIADAAGVSPQTIYNAFQSKAGLFAAVMDVVIAGDHEPIPLANRPDVAALRTIDDPGAFVRAAVAVAVSILQRLQPIYPTLRAAAASDAQIADAHQRFAIDARRSQQRVSAARLHELGALAPGIDIDRATDILWAILSPDLFHLLVGLRGWSAKDFQEWATSLLTDTLIT